MIELTKTMVINLINITRPSLIAKEGIGTVRMNLVTSNSTYTYIPITAGDTVKVRYSPDPTNDYSVAWDNYFMKIPE